MKPNQAVRLALVALLILAPMGASAGKLVRLPGPDVELQALYFPAKRTETEPRAPAILMLHGCSGMFDRAGRPNKSYVFWAEHFQALGYSTLLLDSFTSRGTKEICSHKVRAIRPDHERNKDAHAAHAWLAARQEVDPAKIHLMGWSNGAMTVLHAIKPQSQRVEAKAPAFRSAVALYPGCAALAKDPQYRITSPLLLLVGGADDWTPAAHCESLAAFLQMAGAKVAIDTYPDAHHGFDRLNLSMRHRAEVRNPHSPSGWGATVGTNAAAREKAIARVTTFFRDADAPPAR